jgi:urea transport system substrate-binding protein
VKTTIPVGILYSITGPYGEVSTSMLNAALMGMEECNLEADGKFEMEPHFVDSGGRLSAYSTNCEKLIHDVGCHHIIGCYTSAARKQIRPLLEKTNTLLWHSARYEGFEASENIIYIGAAPNQHLVPLVGYLLQEKIPEIYCVGSNYIWTWESNRVLRDLIVGGGGKIIAERLVTMGDLQIEHIVDEIIALKPPVVFNTLVGEASYRFYRSIWRKISVHPELNPGDILIVSCSLCEDELPLIGEPASIGHITSATYFQSIRREENIVFLKHYRERFGPGSSPSVDAQSAYVGARILGRAIAACGTDAVDAVRNAAHQITFEAPEGPVSIDPKTNHCYLTPRLAVSARSFKFDIFWEASRTVRADPFLAWQDADLFNAPSAKATPSGYTAPRSVEKN